MARVLVIGAGRGVGLETVWQALEAGHEVGALARSASAIEIEHRNLDKINADATGADALDRAIAGYDVVITTLGIAPTFSKVTLFSETAANVIQAMQNNDIRRLIAVTGLGAGNSKGTGGLLYARFLQPLMLGPIYADKDREEKLIQESNLEWTIVRPGFLTRLPKRSDYHVLVEPEEWRAGFITRSDVADFLVKQITDRGLIGKTPMLVND
ncbi:MAG: NAD(P)-dependent oxidoreductase [Methyloligellaceae bacterium]